MVEGQAQSYVNESHFCDDIMQSIKTHELDDIAGGELKTSVILCCSSPEEPVQDDCYQPVRKFESADSDLDIELGLSENYFAQPEGYFCFSTSEELEMAIERCKSMIMSAEDKSDRKKQLVKKLIQLRYKLQDEQDGSEETPNITIVLGHNFEIRSLDRPQQYCEKCCGIIWGVLNNWYRCLSCGFKCHSKCLNLITRICVSTKVAKNCSYELSICPENGLSKQKFRCAECKKKFIFKDNMCLPRLCDYSGQHYCSHCHWNSLSIIPARVLHNWDFTPQKVCRSSLQFLRLMIKKPVLNIESLNPSLFAFVDDLGSVKKLRKDILTMKTYFLTCHAALEEKLLLQLQDRQHFVENSSIYSLQDLIDTSNGFLITYLEKVRETFVTHITHNCLGCRGKGFICELCKSEEVIFPFEARTDTCSVCSSVFHQDCNLTWEGPCPKCARRAKVSSEAKHNL